MAMVLARCSWAPPWPHFRWERLNVPNRSTLRTEAIATNKAALVKKKAKKKKKNSGNSNSPREEEVYEDGDYTDIVDMDEWIKNKPLGFGLGKDYDTSLEEKMLEDIEKGNAAALAGKKKKSMSDPKTATQMERISLKDGKVVEGGGQKSIKARKPEQQVDGVKVKVTHLPRKKNISKDLRLAYKGVSGLLQIRPNELANKKTREPVCKGSAILTFAKEANASRFMEKFRTQKLGFGKLEKLPTYELYVPKSEKEKQTTVTSETKGSEEETKAVQEESYSDVSDDCSDTVQVLVNDDDVDEVVSDYVAAVEVQEEDEENGDEQSDDDWSEEEEEREESYQGEDFEAATAALRSQVADSDEEDDDFSDDETGWIEEDNENDHQSDGEVLEASGENTHFVEVDVSRPLTASDVGGDPEAVILSSNARILELDKEISKLKKSLRRKRKQSPELEQQILKLREEKIELLEKRVLARIVAAREAHRARRAKKLAAAEEETSKRSGRMDDGKMREVVTKHFTKN